MNANPTWSRLALLLSVLLLAACAQPGGPAATKPAPVSATPVEERAVTRWELMIAGKFDEAYEYLSPGYRTTRNKQDYVDIMSKRPVRWTAAEFVDKLCEVDVCDVRVRVDFSLEMPVTGVGKVDSMHFIDEKWILIDGTWFMLPDAQRQGAAG